jgi:hypothetical protein
MKTFLLASSVQATTREIDLASRIEVKDSSCAVTFRLDTCSYKGPIL